VTINANAGHAYIEVAGIYLDTAAGLGDPPNPPAHRPALEQRRHQARRICRATSARTVMAPERVLRLSCPTVRASRFALRAASVTGGGVGGAGPTDLSRPGYSRAAPAFRGRIW
jgi:hypothetical protein